MIILVIIGVAILTSAWIFIFIWAEIRKKRAFDSLYNDLREAGDLDIEIPLIEEPTYETLYDLLDKFRYLGSELSSSKESHFHSLLTRERRLEYPENILAELIKREEDLLKINFEKSKVIMEQLHSTISEYHSIWEKGQILQKQGVLIKLKNESEPGATFYPFNDLFVE